MSTLTLHASGPEAPAEVWDRYVRPARWHEWSPQISRVEVPAERLSTGLRGRVFGPVGPGVPFEVEAVDDAARQWAWTVHAGPVRLRLLHWVVAAPDGGTTTGLRVAGPAPVVLGYAPLARWALGRLVGPLG